MSGGATIDQYLFLLPMIEATYQFGEGPVRFGVGAKAVTFIVESLVWPNAFIEIDLNPCRDPRRFGRGAVSCPSGV